MRAPMALLILVAGLSAQNQAIVNVDVYDVHLGTIAKNVILLIRGDKIDRIGPRLRIPQDAKVFDGEGMTVYPGLIDAWTTLGLTEVAQVKATNDASEIGKWNAHMRAGAAINPHSAHFPVARCNGVTTAVVVPGGGTFSGQAELLDLFGRTVPKMRLEAPGRLRVLRLPGQPRRDYTEKENKGWKDKVDKAFKPVADQLEKARRLGKLLESGNERAGANIPGQERLSLRATAEHLRRGDPWLVWADNREHILAVLDFADKHDLKLVIAGLKDGWKIADRLKDSGHGLLVGSPWVRPDANDPYDAGFANAAAMHRAGCRFGVVSNSSPNVRNLPYQAAMFVAYGLPRAAALRALTIEPARVLGIDATHGSVEEGKVANLVLYDGDPLEASTNPRHLFIRGRRIPLISRHTFLSDRFLDR